MKTWNDWLRCRLEPSVQQGLGKWLPGLHDPHLGASIYESNGSQIVQLFEHGLRYKGLSDWVCLYDEVAGLEPLGLVELMKAQKRPTEAVTFAVLTASGRQSLRLPLFVYTTFTSILEEILRRRGVKNSN